MLSALARPASASLRRSFSTSAQVGPTRGWLQVEAPSLGHVRFWLASGPDLGASLDRRAAWYWLAAVTPWTGPDTGREGRG